MSRRRPTLPLAIALLLAAAALWWALRPGPPPAPVVAPEPEPWERVRPGPLSPLAEPPDWGELDRWQETLTRDEVLAMIEGVFTVSGAWREFFALEEDELRVDSGVPGHPYVLRLAEEPRPATRDWRAAAELGPAPPERPLDGLRVAIDPGHIGGRWARVEERWFRVGDAAPVTEGDMTLRVARLLRPRLEALGAEVTLVRDSPEPVTELRPEALLAEAGPASNAHTLAERLFYRTAEIRARAWRVNREIRPDLVLCLHFNAEAWGDPDAPELVDGHHFHLLLNGAYTDGELELADQRFQILQRILARIHPEELAVNRHVAEAFVERTGLPPYRYEPNSRRARMLDDNPYLWARNLLANRLYQCPVVFLEPYVMNSVTDHARIQAGDYEGLRQVAGKLRPSIFREYADAVTAGLVAYYAEVRE